MHDYLFFFNQTFLFHILILICSNNFPIEKFAIPNYGIKKRYIKTFSHYYFDIVFQTKN